MLLGCLFVVRGVAYCMVTLLFTIGFRLVFCLFAVGYMLFIYVESMFYVFELLLCHVYGLG